MSYIEKKQFSWKLKHLSTHAIQLKGAIFYLPDLSGSSFIKTKRNIILSRGKDSLACLGYIF